MTFRTHPGPSSALFAPIFFLTRVNMTRVGVFPL